MRLTHFTGGICATNGYLVETPDGNLLVDAPEGVSDWLDRRSVRVEHVLLTHQHFDHVLDAAALQTKGAKLHALEDYSTTLTLESLFGGGMGVAVRPYRIDRRLALVPEPVLSVCGLDFTLFHIPGHAPDAVVFHLPALELAFSGDTLFAGSIGRTDLPGGSQQLLLDGIARDLLGLPPQTKLLPGHGPATTVDREKRSNPYL